MSFNLKKISKGFRAHSKGRIAMIGVILLTIGLQYWTWFKRHPLIASEQGKIREIDRLREEVEDLELKWSEPDAKEVADNYAIAQSHLFKGDTNSAEWSYQVDEPKNVNVLDIQVSSRQGVPHPEFAEDLAIVPTIWKLKPAEDGIQMQNELIRFLRELDEQQKMRMDLANLIVTGNGNEMTDAEVGLRLWFRKEDSERAK